MAQQQQQQQDSVYVETADRRIVEIDGDMVRFFKIPKHTIRSKAYALAHYAAMAAQNGSKKTALSHYTAMATAAAKTK